MSSSSRLASDARPSAICATYFRSGPGRFGGHLSLGRPARRALRRARKGVTLVEIMIVVVIMAIIATAVGVAVLPNLLTAKEGIAESNVAAIKQATLNYILHDGDGCPTVDDLIEDGKLDEDVNPVDPWDKEYDIQCTGDNVVVTSAGADGEFETEDDVTTRRGGRR